jgi:integrase
LENNECIRELTVAEEARVRLVIDKSYRNHLPEFEIGLQTGMRQSEQFDLTTWERVNLDTAEIRLPETKPGGSRVVHLNQRALAVMRMLHASSIGTGRVFLLNKDPRWFEQACVDAGFDRHAPRKERVTWHALRHTFISRMVRAGVDLRTVMELAGHKTIQMTMRYAHLTPGGAKVAIERLSSAITTSQRHPSVSGI